MAPSAALPYTVSPCPAPCSSVLLLLVPLLSPLSRSWRFLRCLPALSPVLLLSSSSDDCCPAAVVARVCGSPVLALPRLVPASPSLESPLARASRSPCPAPRFPVLGVGALAGPGARLAASCSRCPVPGVFARLCVTFSTSRPRDSLSLALASSPVPSSLSMSRPTSSLFLSTSASSYSSPSILASLSLFRPLSGIVPWYKRPTSNLCNSEDVTDTVTSDLCCSWRLRYVTPYTSAVV